ncbi:hypothetical protein DPX39_040071500 [Trypanosoma brucei equiperdum]|uniref:PDEase domain-containing protein n=1 Tax=Trypanosoma brucei equiperdum TaxID=630700 RepID=A0A3L6LFW4_9TRYP|nr:hypothetical protein DPX39_040071500 [Trypanosoma brucei equiperdum]
MSQKHIFQRPSMACEQVVGTAAVGTAVASPGSPAPAFDALQRISSLRRSLSNVVASRALSLDRSNTPNPHMPPDTDGLQESTARQLLASSQRRVEELLRENHKLELLCMKQEDTIKEIQIEMTLNKKKEDEPAGNVADNAPGEPPNISQTHSISYKSRGPGTKNKAGRAPDNDGGDIAEAHDGTHRSPSVLAELDEVVQQLVSTAIALFPELEARAESASRDGADEWSVARDIIHFIESHLEEWSDHASQENVDIGEASAMLSQTLTSVEEDQHEWGKSLFDLANRLQMAWSEQRHAITKRDFLISKLKKNIKSLSTELSDAVEVRMQCECRCAELEGALSRMMENHVEHDANVQRLQQECNNLRSETNALLALAGQEGTAAANSSNAGRDLDGISDSDMTKATENGAQSTTADRDAELLRHALERVTKERDQLQVQLDVANDALKGAELRANVTKAEREAVFSNINEPQCSDVAVAANPAAVVRLSQNSADEAMMPLHGPLLSRSWNADDKTCDTTVTPNINLLRIIGDIDADIWSEKNCGASEQGGLLFQVGCAIAQDSELFDGMPEPDLSLTAWKRLLLHIQNGFGSGPFHSADRAADNMQFFYSLMFHSGMLERMTPVERIATTTSALCAMYRYVVPPSETHKSSDAQLRDVASVYPNSLEKEMLESYCNYETICRLMGRCYFNFSAHWEEKDRDLLLRTMRALLLPQESLSQLECLIYAGDIERADGISPRLHAAPVRHQFVRLFIALAQHAFTMRTAAVSRYWASERFGLYQRQTQFINEPSVRPVEVPYNTRMVAEAQLLLINTTVLPLCQTAVRVFPRLQPCLVALQGNLCMWTLCNSDHGDVPPSSIALPPEMKVTPSIPEKNILCKDFGFRLVATEGVTPGTVTLDTAGFISTQDEVSALYKENAMLRGLLNRLFSEMDVPLECTESSQISGG